MDNNLIIVSVGGSLIVPDEIDTGFLKNFRSLILKQTRKGRRFAIMCGGGRTARKYQEASKSAVDTAKEDLDWLGIHSTRLNAHLLRTVFRGHAHPKIVKNPKEKIIFKEKILIAAGWKPGFSTDSDAVLLAENLGIKKLVNMTDVDYVYDKDPRKFRGAKPMKNLTWNEFRNLLPKWWEPGMNAPLDPNAARKAEKLGMEVVIINGKKMKNLENCLEGKDFAGTRIR
ncbi:MAG: UMP kinase [Candidatus Aenigmarchaeota archaeon]|nr:UMP kinase [Candidatus Aenigmarchaeota archaeon]